MNKTSQPSAFSRIRSQLHSTEKHKIPSNLMVIPQKVTVKLLSFQPHLTLWKAFYEHHSAVVLTGFNRSSGLVLQNRKQIKNLVLPVCRIDTIMFGKWHRGSDTECIPYFSSTSGLLCLSTSWQGKFCNQIQKTYVCLNTVALKLESASRKSSKLNCLAQNKVAHWLVSCPKLELGRVGLPILTS